VTLAILLAITITDKWFVEKMVDVAILLLLTNFLRLINIHDLDICLSIG